MKANAAMKLWNVEGAKLANGYEWRGKGWHALVYDLEDQIFVWSLRIGGVAIYSDRSQGYTTARGAKLALERAVKRLGLSVGKAGKNG